MYAASKHFWNGKEVERLLYLRDVKHWPFPRIAVYFDLSESQVSNKYNMLQQKMRAQRHEKLLMRRVPNKVLIERERRDLAREQQTGGGVAFGDPPPGYSALDKKRRGVPS